MGEPRPRAALIGGVTIVVNGFGLLLATGRYTSGTYEIAKQLCPLRWWGAVFVAIGLAVVIYPHPVTAGLLAGVTAGWGFALFGAVLTGYGQTFLGPVVWLGFAAIIFSSITRFGTGRRRLPHPDGGETRDRTR
jgi:hypothetical protein